MIKLTILDPYATYILCIINWFYYKHKPDYTAAQISFWDKVCIPKTGFINPVSKDVEMALVFLAEIGYIEDIHRPIPTQKGRYYFFYVAQFLIIRFIIPAAISLAVTLIAIWLKWQLL